MGLPEIVQNYVHLPRGVQKMAFHKGFQVELRQDLDRPPLALNPILEKKAKKSI